MSMTETHPQPNAVLVVYEMTYMLENYDSFICRLGAHPNIGGCVFIRNTGLKTLLQGLILMLSLATPRLGWQIILNALCIHRSWKKRHDIFQKKKILLTNDINDPQVVSFIQENQFNFLIHSRTTTIFKKYLLDLFHYGGVNIHHGVLPGHRGLMCDFWSHLHQKPFGFSIHFMTAKIDDGPLLLVKELEKTNSYLLSANMSAIQEADACEKILNELKIKKELFAQPQDKKSVIYEKAPGLRHGYLMQIKGIKI